MLTHLPSPKIFHLFSRYNMRKQKTCVAVFNIRQPETDTFFYLMPYQITMTIMLRHVTGCLYRVFESSCAGTLFQTYVGSRMLGNKRAHRFVPTLIIGKSVKSLEYLHSLCGLMCSTHATCSCCNKFIFRRKFTDAPIPFSKKKF
jgi:hypothetical protein